jgi:hypothetical protein
VLAGAGFGAHRVFVTRFGGARIDLHALAGFAFAFEARRAGALVVVLLTGVHALRVRITQSLGVFARIVCDTHSA